MKAVLQSVTYIALISTTALSISACHTTYSDTTEYSTPAPTQPTEPTQVAEPAQVAAPTQAAARRVIEYKTYQKSVTLESDNGEFAEINVKGPLDQVPVELQQGGNQVVVTATFASDNPARIDSFLRDTIHVIKDGQLNIILGGLNYSISCSKTSINGVQHVTGLCVQSVHVLLPTYSHTQVYVGHRLVNPSMYAPQAPVVTAPRTTVVVRTDNGSLTPPSTDVLLDALRSVSFENDKLRMINSFATSNASRGRYITVAQVMSLMSTLTFDSDKVKVANIFSGHVFDRTNASLVASLFSFDSDKTKAVRALSI